MAIEFCWRLIFEILIIHKPSLETKKLTHRQTSKVYIYIDMKTFQISVFCAIYFRRTGMSISPLNQVLIYVMLCYVMLCYVMLSRKIVLSLK